MSEARHLQVIPGGRDDRQAVRIPILTRASSVETQKIEWLAYGYLAAGKLTILDGDPGLGKSTIAIDWSARITRGEAILDGGQATRPRGVVFISDEDGREDTIKPRLEAAGADLTKICFFHFENEDGEESLPEFPRDGAALGDAAEAIDAALIVIDPLMLYLEPQINANRDADVRRALNPIVKAAERTGAAILILRHLTKGGGPNALYRGGGSIGIIGAARIGLMVARDTKTDESGKTCALACTKNNIAPFPPTLNYTLQSAPGSHVARVAWLGVSQRSADDMLDTEERSARDEAADFLRDLLINGPVAVQEIQREARGAGISWRTLERAKADLHVRAVKNKYMIHGGWAWTLPSKPATQHNSATQPRQPETQNSPEIREHSQPSQDHQQQSDTQGIYICRSCQLPRALDASVCPSCGGRDGVWR